MNKQQRAAHYLARIRETRNSPDEVERILSELNSLVWTESQKPLTKQDKLAIIEEIRSQAFPLTKSWEVIVEASDNSGILDVISALKKGAKD